MSFGIEELLVMHDSKGGILIDNQISKHIAALQFVCYRVMVVTVDLKNKVF